MGNQLAQPTKPLSEHLTELPNVVLKDSLGGGRFLKTLLCVHDEGGLVVVKVYYKRGDSPPLEPFRKQLVHIRNSLVGIDCPHVWPFQFFYETQSAGYMIRQHMFANLYDRLSTRPFLSRVEKRWITFQLLHALAQCHERGICHGDVKCENVLVTSWNWVFLVDFACYKPTYLPADNPADFSFFFDTGSRRRCYIAPERFYQGSSSSVNSHAPLQPAMDIFSLGCCLAELHLDGKAFFELSHLLEYRRGEYDPRPMLASVDPDMQALILHMIQLDPARRWAARDYLTSWPRGVFPPTFEDPLHPLFNHALRLDTDARVAALHRAFSTLKAVLAPGNAQASQAAQLSAHTPAASLLPLAPPAAAPPSPGGADASGDLQPAQGLLADVGELAAEADQLQARLEKIESKGGARVEAEWKALGNGLVEERVMEEMWEYEVQEDGQWIGPTSVAADAGEGSSGAVYPRDIPLPPGGGWSWVEEWWVDTHKAPCDKAGWQYRRNTQDGVLLGRWGAADCAEGSIWRRRRWVRLRTRQVPDPLEALPSSAAAAEAVAAEAVAGKGPGGADGAAGEAAEGAGREAGGDMVLLAVLLCTLLRGSKLMESKRCAVAMLYEAAVLCDSETRLQCVVPNMLTLVAEGHVAVRTLALRCLVKLICGMGALPLGDAKVFHDYLLPSLSLLPHDAEEAIRVEYAIGIAHLAAASHHHLLKLQRDSQEAALAQASPAPPTRYNSDMAAMRSAVEKEVTDLLTGLHNTSEVQRALLSHIWLLFSSLCRGETMLLPLLLTTMNSSSWQVRSAFFQAVASIAALTGQRSLDLFVSPIFEQALSYTEAEVSVKADAVRCVAAVTNSVSRRFLMTAARRVASLLSHPAAAVRLAAVSCIAAAAKVLHPADVYTQLMTLFDGALSQEPLLLTDEASIVAALHPPPRPPRTPTPLTPTPPPSPLTTPARSLATTPTRSPLTFPSATTPPATPPLAASSFSSRTPRRPLTSGPGSPIPAPPLDIAPPDPDLLLRPSAPVYSIELDPAARSSTASLHTAAIASIGSHVAALEKRIAELKMRVLPAGLAADPLERQTVERLSATVARLQLPPESDVRDEATRSTFKLTQLALRVAPHPSELQPAASSRLGYNLLQPYGDAPQGLGVSDAVASALSTGIMQQASAASSVLDSATATWQPHGVLVAHLLEHRAAINKLAVARNGAFFASASNDSTVKIWDLRRLEKDVSFHSRLTYAAQAGRILAVAPAEGDQSIASASSTGTIDLWRVEYTSRSRGIPDKYTGIVGRCTLDPQEGAVLELAPWGNLLLYSTQRGGVHAWDPRQRGDAWVLRSNPRRGLTEKLVVDPTAMNWVLTGSTVGCMALWDVRFQLQVNAWQHPLSLPITAMAPSVAEPRSLGLQPPTTPRTALAAPPATGPLVYVAAGHNEVALWDVASGTCRQVMRVVTKEEATTGTSQAPAALSLPDMGAGALTTAGDLPSAAAALPQPAPLGFRALLPSPLGQLLTAGGDRCIRYWDAGLPKRSYMVVGPIWPQAANEPGERVVATRQSYQYSSREVGGVPVVEEWAALEATEEKGTDSLPEQKAHLKMDDLCHADCITHMVAAEGNSPMLLTCSRDGCIKAWK